MVIKYLFFRAPPRLDWSPMPQWWESETPPCSAHDHERLRPEVVAMPALAAPAVSSPTTSTVIYPEAQVFYGLFHYQIADFIGY